MDIDLKSLTNEELSQLRIDVLMELERRRNLESIPQSMDALSERYLAAQGINEDDPWRPPTAAYDAYPLGFRVNHNGKFWVSLAHSNMNEPGVRGWAEKIPEAVFWSSNVAYKLNDLVSYRGSVYRALQAHTSTPRITPLSTDYWMLQETVTGGNRRDL